MTLKGKGIFIWKIWECEGGNVGDIAAMVENADLGHVLIKVADEDKDYNAGLVSPLISTLRSQIPGIGVWAWHYVYGYKPEDEASKALERIGELDIDGYVINAEGEYKNKSAQAHQFMNIMNAGANIPLALSSYRFPSYHMTFPWEAFLGGVDINMPQVYWVGASNPKEQLQRSVAEFGELYADLGVSVPIFPTGAAYGEGGWTATAVEVLEFLEEAKRLAFPGCNFWEYSEARHDHPELWQAIAGFGWPWKEEEPEKPPIGIDDIDDILRDHEERLSYIESIIPQPKEPVK